MTAPNDLRAQAERCRLVGSRYGGRHEAPMQDFAARLEVQALSLEVNKAATPPTDAGS
jgi:hypothetical protein